MQQPELWSCRYLCSQGWLLGRQIWIHYLGVSKVSDRIAALFGIGKRISFGAPAPVNLWVELGYCTFSYEPKENLKRHITRKYGPLCRLTFGYYRGFLLKWPLGQLSKTKITLLNGDFSDFHSVSANPWILILRQPRQRLSNSTSYSRRP